MKLFNKIVVLSLMLSSSAFCELQSLEPGAFKDLKTNAIWRLVMRPSGQGDLVQAPPSCSSGEVPTKAQIDNVFKQGAWEKIVGAMPVRGSGVRFWTNETIDAPILRTSYWIFKPFSHPRFDFYSSRGRFLGAYLLCVEESRTPVAPEPSEKQKNAIHEKLKLQNFQKKERP